MHRRPKASYWLPGGALCVAAAAAAVLAAPLISYGDAAAFAGTLLCAPKTALTAAGDCLSGSGEAALPEGFSAYGGADRDSADADWTQLPSADIAAPAASVPEAGGASSSSSEPEAPAEVPEGMVPLLSAHYDQGSGAYYIACGTGTIKNCTELPASEVAAEVGQALPFTIEPGSTQPQVLIMHTHATETYEQEDKTWCDPSFSARSTDTAVNMVAVGERIANALNAAGVYTLHDTTLHDYPSYTGSYANSNATVRSYLEKYPSIKVVLDVHRDAIQQADGTRIKPVATINGKQAAQVMIICGADLNGNLPNFHKNLRFAARWEAKMEQMYPGLTRPVLFDYRYYNQDLTTGSLLIEVGGHANTLEEAEYAGDLVGSALGALFTGK